MRNFVYYLSVIFAFIVSLSATNIVEDQQKQLWSLQQELIEKRQQLDSKLFELQCNLEDLSEKINNPVIEKTFADQTIHSEIYDYMKQKLVCAEANLALAAHESGHFSSYFFKKSNNMFSMGLSKRPYDFKIWNSGDGNYKAGFNDWKKSIDDMASWQRRHIEAGNIDTTSNETYIKSLRGVGFAEDPNHENAVLSTYHRLFIDWNEFLKGNS